MESHAPGLPQPHVGQTTVEPSSPSRHRSSIDSPEIPRELVSLSFGAVEGGFNHPGECAICYEAFQHLEEAQALPCTVSSACPSIYHAPCIEKWLAKDPSCPLCRRSFPELSSADEVTLAFGHGAPLFDPPPISNPFRAESQERWLSARELAQRYRAGPSWRDVAPTSGQSASSSGGYTQNATELDCVAPPVNTSADRRNGLQSSHVVPSAWNAMELIWNVHRMERHSADMDAHLREGSDNRVVEAPAAAEPRMRTMRPLSDMVLQRRSAERSAGLESLL